MVRHHVAQRAGRVVEAAAVADAELLVDGDLHVVDVIAVPDRLEHAVGEAQHQDVLHRLLAEVVIDAVDLVLVESFSSSSLSAFAEARSVPNGFSTTSRRHAPFFLQHAGAAELAGDRLERARRRRQIKQPIAAGLALGFDFSSWSRMASNEAGSLLSASMQVTHERAAVWPPRRRSSGSRTCCRPFIRLSGQLCGRHALACDADKAEVLGQQRIAGRCAI